MPHCFLPLSVPLCLPKADVQQGLQKHHKIKFDDTWITEPAKGVYTSPPNRKGSCLESLLAACETSIGKTDLLLATQFLFPPRARAQRNDRWTVFVWTSRPTHPKITNDRSTLTRFHFPSTTCGCPFGEPVLCEICGRWWPGGSMRYSHRKEDTSKCSQSGCSRQTECPLILQESCLQSLCLLSWGRKKKSNPPPRVELDDRGFVFYRANTIVGFLEVVCTLYRKNAVCIRKPKPPHTLCIT